MITFSPPSISTFVSRLGFMNECLSHSTLYAKDQFKLTDNLSAAIVSG